MQCRARASWTAAVLLLAAAVTGCGVPEARLRETVLSAGATAERIGDAWLDGSIPTTYARRTLHAVREDLGEARRELRDDSPSQERTGILERIDRLAAAIQRLESAVGERDQQGATRATAEIRALTSQVRTWARREAP
jgi:hypothetical protein